MHAAATHTHTHTRRATCPPPDLPAAAANASLPRKRRAIRVSTLLIVTLVVLRQAADWYQAEESTSAANACLLKVAGFEPEP